MSKKASKDQRKLKVYTKYAFSKFGKPSIFPEIRLKGYWVDEWGYNCGDKIRLIKAGDCIIIKNTKSQLIRIRL